MKPSSLLTIAQSPEKTTWDTTTNNYERVKIPLSFPSQKALIIETPYMRFIPIMIKIAGISDFEDTIYQTLVEDNLLRKEKPILIPLSSAILNLKNFVQKTKQDIKDFRKAEDERLENISLEEIEE